MGWKLDYVLEEVPLVWLMLLWRQKIFNDKGFNGFSLMEQEQIDRNKSLPWEEQVRLSRERLK